jgi:hypothetical protein
LNQHRNQKNVIQTQSSFGGSQSQPRISEILPTSQKNGITMADMMNNLPALNDSLTECAQNCSNLIVNSLNIKPVAARPIMNNSSFDNLSNKLSSQQNRLD